MPKTIPSTKKILAQQLQQYKEQNKINNPFGIEDIQHYLLTTTEQELNREKNRVRGIYTSKLIEQIEGDNPITIDMQGRAIACLLYDINTPRNITINNTTGDETGSHAGSDRGQANLTINNTKGDWTGAEAGKNHGNAHIIITNTEGDWTGANAGSHHGNANLTINNTTGDYTGMLAGSEHGTAHLTITNTEGYRTGTQVGFNGNAIIVAYNNQGKYPFPGQKGILVFQNPNREPIMQGIDNPETRAHILNLIAQNAPSEVIMAYLRGNT